MECPICKFEMESGHASVHGTLIGVLLFGMSREHLWFQGDQSKHRLLKSKMAWQHLTVVSAGHW